MKVDGKVVDTGIPYLEPNNTYIVHYQGYRIYVTVNKERPNFCEELPIIKKALIP